MTFLLRFFLFSVVSLGLGLGTARRALERGVYGSTRTAGPWVVWPREGNADADPYTQARTARLGILPVNSTGHLVFSAETDSSGRALNGDCTYEVRGSSFPALWWGVAIYNADGGPLQNNGRRTGLNSSSIIMQADGKFLVRIAPGVQPGNWLASARSAPLSLKLSILRPLNADAIINAEDDLPTIKRVECS